MDAKKPQRLSFTQMGQAQFIEELYERYKKNPTEIDSSWRRFFEGMEFAQLYPDHATAQVEPSNDLAVFQLIEAYRLMGHRAATFNPLSKITSLPQELEPHTYGLIDLSQQFNNQELLHKEQASAEELVSQLQKIYCGSIGFEYKHIQEKSIRDYIQSELESKEGIEPLSKEEKLDIYNYLNHSEIFESFLHTKFVGQKRFSLEGLETFIPILRAIVDEGSNLGINELAICMAHRGRLNVLANIFEKPYSMIFHEFGAEYSPSSFEGSGDVKYHRGYTANIESKSGNKVHISIPPNSSHLEAVNAVLQGQIRAKQYHKKDLDRSQILPIQIHGDASISGQGVVYEVLQMYKLKGYETGGSVHIILDNQIGFTTLPEDDRSTLYPSDIAKTFDSPVFHVNAEDPEGCVKVTHLALKIRQKFKCDVFIHLVGYRKYGHNEGDEPAYTQPLEYQQIRSKKTIREIYKEHLIKQDVLSMDKAKTIEAEFRQTLQSALEESIEYKDHEPDELKTLGVRWSFWKDAKLKNEAQLYEVVETKVDTQLIKDIAIKMTEIPQGFSPHKKIAQLLAMRRAAALENPPKEIMDWGLVENLAYGSLLLEGVPIRLSGQDCQRGTFSHRHAMIVDQKTAEKYFPLQHLSEDQGGFRVFNSLLSEYAALGFEYGFSISTPKGLIIWEAQFGDFANGAQIMIDAFIANGEEKWNRLTNLVMLLPHGYEGQGPEHSSARIERFLQLTGDNNMFLLNLSTPAQLFHALRRQVHKKFRKPLVIFTPKALLRHPKCVSSITDLSEGQFEEILDDPEASKKTKKLVFCSGKMYYELIKEREKRAVDDTTILRIEQLYPLNIEKLRNFIEKYSGFEKCYWVQEEPKNMGAWYNLRSLLQKALPNRLEPIYCGRKRQASPATGSHKNHIQSLNQIFKELFEG